MAEGAQAPPTFKLVLVGDGGTGKVGEPFEPPSMPNLVKCSKGFS